jgi:hypothetical protein
VLSGRFSRECIFSHLVLDQPRYFIMLIMTSDINCNGGQQLGNIVKPGINNLADFGFNDVANAFKVSFR